MRRGGAATLGGWLLLALALATGAAAATAAATAAGRWRPGPRLATARYLASATVLTDGSVLVTGGFGSAPLASCERYDPASGRWSAAAPLYSPRFAHTATRLADGTVLVAGGANLTAGYLDSALRYLPPTVRTPAPYGPTAGRWIAAAPMPSPRANATATLLGDGRVLIAGGLHDRVPALTSAVLYDPAHNRWSAAASMRTARYHATATLLRDGRVLLVGGEQDRAGSLRLLRSAELYDPRSGRWHSAATLPYPLANQTATLLADGRVLVAGGGDRAPGFTARAELYDPRHNRWRAARPLPMPRAFATAVRLLGGRVLVAGGIDDRGALAGAELYDPRTGRWRSAGRTVSAYRESSVLLGDGRALVIGGQRYNGPAVATTSLFTPGLAPGASAR